MIRQELRACLRAELSIDGPGGRFASHSTARRLQSVPGVLRHFILGSANIIVGGPVDISFKMRSPFDCANCIAPGMD